MVFFPLEMADVARQHVVMAWLVRELAHRHKAMTSAHVARRAKTSKAPRDKPPNQNHKTKQKRPRRVLLLLLYSPQRTALSLL